MTAFTQKEHGGGRDAASVVTVFRDDTAPVLQVRNLSIRTRHAELVQNVSFDVMAGETLCLVGESGCGKSLTCMSALGLLDDSLSSAGSVRFLGQEILSKPDAELDAIRGRDVTMIFQNPMTALNPIQRVGRQIAEALLLHSDLRGAAVDARVLELLDQVGIPNAGRHAKFYPHQLSGGMCQRVMIAMALACNPKLIVADEPTTALDVTIQAQILRLIKSLQFELGVAVVFVTHDLGVVAEIADRVAVMYSGRIVEAAPVNDLFEAPRHPYTRSLMDCRIGLQRKPGTLLDAIPGTVPHPAARPEGCAFAPRCPIATEICSRPPEFSRYGAGNGLAACHYASIGKEGAA